ncbi:MAG: UPF0301 protein [Gammaproteobacteria bacterium]|nr:MAG: UPF0301 protein [Gammaproteobacteria bacterium]
METTSLKNHFLIAMPALADPNFHGTVTLLCEHDEKGALGLVLNRPSTLSLGELLAQLEIPCNDPALAARPVHAGGPVNPESGFVLHRPPGQWTSSLIVSDALALTTSLDILQALAAGEGPSDFIVALGYAGWGAGQLEQELAANAWLTHPADPDMIFTTPPEALWNAAARAIGIDPDRLSSEAGHA